MAGMIEQHPRLEPSQQPNAPQVTRNRRCTRVSPSSMQAWASTFGDGANGLVLQIVAEVGSG
ncbi:MAG: hypothetical protein IH941_02585 [Acidobacteria bacterium]|nr:hypothetical protein [Acidobacteriota bacterium]